MPRSVLLALSVAFGACSSSEGVRSPKSESDDLAIATYIPPTAPRRTFTAGVLPAGAPPVIAVFGDSLTVQARNYVQALATYGGYRRVGAEYVASSLCDWTRDIRTTLRRERPSYLVLAFAGNALSKCTWSPTGEGQTGTPLGEVYGRDANAMIAAAWAVNARVVLIGPPDMGDAVAQKNAVAVREKFRAIADANDDVDYVGARRTISPDGFRVARPCLAYETRVVGCRNGRIDVRRSDGVHFANPNDRGYSSGAWRWASVLFAAVPPVAGSQAASD